MEKRERAKDTQIEPWEDGHHCEEGATWKTSKEERLGKTASGIMTRAHRYC